MTTQAEFVHSWYIRHKEERAAYYAHYSKKHRGAIYKRSAFERLARKGFERQRLTSHLIWIVNDAANEIADMGEPGTQAHVDGVGILTIQVWKSHAQVRKVLVYGDPKDDLDEKGHELRCPGSAFGFDVDPNHLFFMDGDITSQGRAASKDNYLAFAAHVPQIVKAFAVEEDKVIKRLLASFDELRHVIGST